MILFTEILTPVIGTITILAMLFAIGAPIYIFLEKTEMGARFKNATPWMGWIDNEAHEDEYTNFVIHPSNYIKVPSSR